MPFRSDFYGAELQPLISLKADGIRAVKASLSRM